MFGGTNSFSTGRSFERARRRDLERAYNRIPKRERMPLFSAAAKAWLDSKTGLAPRSKARYEQCVENLKAEFGGRLICDIDTNDIAGYQRKRLADGVSNRTVNYEVGALRGILKQYGLWGPIADRVRSLRERHDVGRAVSFEDEEKLMAAVKTSGSPALLPLFILSLDTGLRSSELRHLRRRDLVLSWSAGVIKEGEVVVPKSKTEAGTGRIVPLTHRARAILTMWLSKFPDANADSYVFPRHKVNMGWNADKKKICRLDLTRPMGSWKTAWKTACEQAGIRYRWHDLRHTFVSRLAENPNVSEETIRALAGHVSQRMLQRYSHIRVQAKRAAIASLEPRQIVSTETRTTGTEAKPS